MVKTNNNKTVDTVAYSVRRPALVVRGASKKYGSQLVLHNLNMFAKEGTMLVYVQSKKLGYIQKKVTCYIIILFKCGLFLAMR